MKGVIRGVEVDLGAEDRVRILEISKCSLEKRDVSGFGEEEAENRVSGATRNGFAPAKLGASGGSDDGIGRGWVAGLTLLGYAHGSGSQ